MRSTSENVALVSSVRLPSDVANMAETDGILKAPLFARFVIPLIGVQIAAVIGDALKRPLNKAQLDGGV